VRRHARAPSTPHARGVRPRDTPRSPSHPVRANGPLRHPLPGTKGAWTVARRSHVVENVLHDSMNVSPRSHSKSSWTSGIETMWLNKPSVIWRTRAQDSNAVRWAGLGTCSTSRLRNSLMGFGTHAPRSVPHTLGRLKPSVSMMRRRCRCEKVRPVQ
jgi:hypothetical protein